MEATTLRAFGSYLANELSRLEQFYAEYPFTTLLSEGWRGFRWEKLEGKGKHLAEAVKEIYDEYYAKKGAEAVAHELGLAAPWAALAACDDGFEPWDILEALLYTGGHMCAKRLLNDDIKLGGPHFSTVMTAEAHKPLCSKEFAKLVNEMKDQANEYEVLAAFQHCNGVCFFAKSLLLRRAKGVPLDDKVLADARKLGLLNELNILSRYPSIQGRNITGGEILNALIVREGAILKARHFLCKRPI